MSATTKRPHVLILGAGLGGLTLAQALRKKGISFEIFERDAGLHTRFQGWAIALHKMLHDFKESMPDDLGPVETTSHLLPLEIPTQFTMWFGNTRKASVVSNSEHQIVRSNRSRLKRIEEKEDSVSLFFEDGTSATGDVLVGADGVHSQVRSHLFNGEDHLRTLPLETIIGQPTLTKEQYQRQLQIGHSAYVVVIDLPRRLFVGLNSIDQDEQNARYYWTYTSFNPSADAAWTQSASKEKLHEHALKQTKGLDPKLSEIVRLTKVEDMMLHPIIIRDIELQSMPNSRITLLGDAAHAMAPHRGEGGNHAMQDALNLARAIADSQADNPLKKLKEYQDEMLRRGGEAVRNSRAATSDDGSGSTAGWSSWRAQVPDPAPKAVEAH